LSSNPSRKKEREEGRGKERKGREGKGKEK
jgi:hypothetical protein